MAKQQKLVTRQQLGYALGCDPRTAAKRHKPVATLVLGDQEVPLYALPTTQE